MVLKLLFVVFPLVSSVAVQAFDCQKFDNGEFWLRADYKVKCGDVVNGTVDCTSSTAPYSTSTTARCTGRMSLRASSLLGFSPSCSTRSVYRCSSSRFSSRAASSSRASRRRRRSLRRWKLCAEYRKRFFVWEALESLKKVFFVSLVRLVKPDTLSQLLLALVVALSVSWYTVCRSFKRASDNFLAVLSGGAYCLILLGALTLKLGDIYETLLNQDKLSRSSRTDSKCVAAGARDALFDARLRRFAAPSCCGRCWRLRQPKLRYAGSHTLVVVPLPTGKTHHLFISLCGAPRRTKRVFCASGCSRWRRGCACGSMSRT